MPKIGLKFFLTALALQRRRRRIDWFRAIAIFTTLVTIGLIAFYISQRGVIG